PSPSPNPTVQPSPTETPVEPTSTDAIVTSETVEPTTTGDIVTTEPVQIPTTTDSATDPISTVPNLTVTKISGTIVTIGPGQTPGPGIGGGNGGSSDGTSKASLGTAGIVGIAVGSVALLALIAGIFFFMFRRQSRRLENPNGQFVSRAGAGGAAATGDLGHLYGSRQPEGSGSNNSYHQLPGGAPTAGHIVVAPEMIEHPANHSNLNLHSGPMAFGTAAGIGATSGLAGVHSPDGYHESLSDGRDHTSSSYGASGGSGPAISGTHSASGHNPFGTASGSQPQSAPSGGSGSPQSQKGSIHYI
ncbi:hypothetical protein BGZ94_001822, partial [Podila epigama]